MTGASATSEPILDGGEHPLILIADDNEVVLKVWANAEDRRI